MTTTVETPSTPSTEPAKPSKVEAYCITYDPDRVKANLVTDDDAPVNAPSYLAFPVGKTATAIIDAQRFEFINPGVNWLKAADASDILDHPLFQQYKEIGAIQVYPCKASKTLFGTYAAIISESDRYEAVRSTFSVTQLTSCTPKGRSLTEGLAEAIEAQRRKLTSIAERRKAAFRPTA